ncbi:MAG: tetratricopeptide repeat protein [Treponema sp.]|jgi:tetratricopeptide (TPR) repeat protein|nr:tetratricopeptide repeat protein [Treponema sp.]
MDILKIIFDLATLGVFIFMVIRNKRRALNVYAAYYKNKRQQFQWLDNWINKNVDPAPVRAKNESFGKNFLSIIVYLAIVFLANFIFGNKIIVHVISTIIAVLVMELMSRGKIKPGSDTRVSGLTLECPKCGCPHSWVMLKSVNVVEGKRTTTSKTTTTVKGGGTDWGFGAGDTQSTKINSVVIVYHGKATRDFKCLNCGHTHQQEYPEIWHDSKPSSIEEFDPPKPAWGQQIDFENYVKANKSKQADIVHEKNNKSVKEAHPERFKSYSKEHTKEEWAKVAIGESYMEKEDYKEAINHFSKILPICTLYYYDVLEKRAKCYLEIGSYDEAIKDCDEYLLAYGDEEEQEIHEIRETALKKKG